LHHHYYRLTFHHRGFHCRSDKSVGVILPPSVGSIGRPRKEWNRLWKTINAAVVLWLNSTIVWNSEPTGIGVMAAGPTRPSSVPAVVNSAWVISPLPNYPQHSCITITFLWSMPHLPWRLPLLLHLKGWPI
jgi:hypothetical protein